MKKLIFVLIIPLSAYGCINKSAKEPTNSNNIEGSWKMVYAETKENDSIVRKDLSNTSFVKFIGKNHFAFFNQENSSASNFYSGGGTYSLKGDNYTETLKFSANKAIRNHAFSFTVRIVGDTLIQSGLEKVPAANMNREIIEKYIKLK
ncbi:MAG: hypothetical protein JXR05_08885 [Flavobacteriaceae bacterium]